MQTLTRSQPWFGGLGLLFALFFTFISPSHAETTTEGKVVGGVEHEMPEWFKESFLEIQEDVKEASAGNKHVMLFFHLNNCPYCDKMLKDNFLQEPSKTYIQENFDVIAINVKGDRQVQYSKELAFSEKELADELEVALTPTISFINSENKTVARLNGYRSPEQFKPVLDYVAKQIYKTESLSDYLAKQPQSDQYTLRPNELFQPLKDLSSIKTPLAVIFESSTCSDCAYFHDTLLQDEAIKTEFKALTVVRFDANDSTEIIDVNGQKTTPKDWLKQLKLSYQPGMVFFDEGKEVTRLEGKLFNFHFQQLLNYVSSQGYKEHSFPAHLGLRQAELLQQGKTVDISE
ncbi:Thioredoxin-related protein [Thiothrix eikelboomii]|uniref:Thioredoxin-related protein n=1 Tax=Thiothrix eikelboomii TaxID=92487 RepID=A0A1T4VU10_9GAMM|nr:thioredoxin fold domain-containing protein [Thiothrix eikelboomii]SKA68480.1 Thioredoxin-related protein [Thiothrix eikelboomii]